MCARGFAGWRNLVAMTRLLQQKVRKTLHKKNPKRSRLGFLLPLLPGRQGLCWGRESRPVCYPTNNTPVRFNHEPVNFERRTASSFSHLVGHEPPRLRPAHVINSANFAPML